jgi:proline iminopeptidase
MPRGDLFPEIGPYETCYLPLSGGHVMYCEQAGNPNGRPVLFLHGGPGAGAGAVHRRFFDPGYWRIIIFDQRGAGRSRPLGGLEHNTTPDLVADIESLRQHLAIERFLLFGGSWGSTLALAYAQAHPQRVAGCVLRGVFLGRQQEVDWFLHGMRAVFPEAHAAFAGFLPEHERHDLLGSYLRRLIDPDPLIHLPAARAWSVYEGTCSTLLPSPETVLGFSQDRSALGLARIEAHYFAHGLFLPPCGLLGHMDAIAHIPAEVVQGRYDMICPSVTAFELASAWRNARLTVVPDAGHSALEAGIRRALVAAVERFRSGR